MDHRKERLACPRERALADLRWHWGEAYFIAWADGIYRASRRDTAATLTCDSADGLRALIRQDYEAKPVPRDLPVQRHSGERE